MKKKTWARLLSKAAPRLDAREHEVRGAHGLGLLVALEAHAVAPVGEPRLDQRRVARIDLEPAAAPAARARVRCTGYDRPGIVYQVTEVLASAGFNIDELTTDTIRVSGKDGKTRPFFLLEGVVTAPDKVPIQAFEKKLEGLRSSLDAKITVTWS